VINYEHEEFLIPNIFIPIKDRRKGIGLGLIAFIFEIAKTVNFQLALIQLTDSFRAKMLKRGAIETGQYDCLEIVETTNFK
jgi:predicted acetyltransferase